MKETVDLDLIHWVDCYQIYGCKVSRSQAIEHEALVYLLHLWDRYNRAEHIVDTFAWEVLVDGTAAISKAARDLVIGLTEAGDLDKFVDSRVHHVTSTEEISYYSISQCLLLSGRRPNGAKSLDKLLDYAVRAELNRIISSESPPLFSLAELPDQGIRSLYLLSDNGLRRGHKIVGVDRNEVESGRFKLPIEAAHYLVREAPARGTKKRVLARISEPLWENSDMQIESSWIRDRDYGGVLGELIYSFEDD